MRERFGPGVLALWIALLIAAPATGEARPDPPARPEIADSAEPPLPELATQDTAPVAANLEPDPLFDEALDVELDLKVAPDPLEGMNRGFFTFNQWLDRFFWEPITKTYRFAVPHPGRQAVRRVFLNISSAPIFVNDVLQLRFRDAGQTLGRFVLNTTVGAGGLFDAGIEAGWEFHDRDFGQTLAVYGVPSGPYVVIPIFGPSTLRDGFGEIVDRMFEPLTYVFGIGLLGSSLQVAIGSGTGITTYEAHADELDALEDSSIDFYAALRSVYLQNRAATIDEVLADSWLADNGSPPPSSEAD